MKNIEIPLTRNLQQDGAQATARRIPVLLYFSQQHCSFCHRLEDEILVPMLISGAYEDRIILRKAPIDEATDIVGFDGRRVNPRMLFHEYDGIVTPTLVITDGTGDQLTQPFIGINTVELFGWYLDDAIEKATLKMRKPLP